MKFKYIIIEKANASRPILFSIFLDHAFISECIKARYPGIPIVSAGFVRVTQNEQDPPEFLCYGQSIGLKLKARQDEDSKIISNDYQFEL